jgi:hypothetical protein
LLHKQRLDVRIPVAEMFIKNRLIPIVTVFYQTMIKISNTAAIKLNKIIAQSKSRKLNSPAVTDEKFDIEKISYIVLESILSNMMV